MPLSADELLDALRRYNAKQIQLAGQRYTPGVEPGAPNLTITSVLTAVANVACSPAAKERLSQFVAVLTEDWGRAKHSCETQEKIQRAIDALSALVDSALPRMCAREASALDDWKTLLSSIAADLEVERKRWHDKEAELAAHESKDKSSDRAGGVSQRDAIRSHVFAISGCISTLTEEQEFMATQAAKVLIDPFLLVSGEWGTGKTHLLCDVTQHRLRAKQTTLLILAKNFQGHSNLLDLICEEIAPGLTTLELIDHLQMSGKSVGERSLIIVDGVNEGRRAEWRKAINELLNLVRERSHVGLIISCRTPFERIAIAETDLPSFHEIVHHGFEDQEFDAQAAFFQYYKLPLPEVPLLDSEFSRPLTLKLICQSLKNLTGKKLRDGFSGIASGQRGMTFVLESFVNRIGKSIEKEFALPDKACWWLLKGSTRIKDRQVAGFAPNMAMTLNEYVHPRAAYRILSAHFPTLSKKRRNELLDTLRTNGLIDEDVIWYRVRSDVKSRVVYRLPYQRFSDHLIARHLLEAYLDVSSEASVKRSFTRGKPLGRIFRRSRHSQGYTRAGWVQALITEFPERVRKKVPNTKRELAFYLPRAAQRPSLYFEPFIEGLFWRNPSTFTEGTRRVINTYLTAGRQDMWDRTIDALVAISTKPKHPYHSRRLYKFLARFHTPERDLLWTEYLRRKYSSSTIQRLLTWAEKLNVAEMSEEVAKELIILLSLLLTTVVHRDRDVATKALVLIGERYPRALFEHAITTLHFNDPYVPERMLAAAYGVTMSLVDVSDASEFRRHLGWLARKLYRKMFVPNARYGTHHALWREYALGIIRLSLASGSLVLPKTSSRHLSPPFSQIRSPFPDIASAPTEVHEAVKSAIQMDFGNYTIGRLIPHRSNYDDKNPEYIRVRAQIEQRMYDLGYRKEHFEQIDREIARSSSYDRHNDGSKTDRYGKKYSWIAYFEMYGLREAKRLLPDRRIDERTPDVDIDPSFPMAPEKWSAPVPDLFGDLSKDSDIWVAGGETPDFSPLLCAPEINGVSGPWVLLDGHVRGERKDIDRELFAFLRGLFVRSKDIPRLRRAFLAIDYPGNDRIPDGGEDYYLYAGEVGRSPRYAPTLRMLSGRYRRQTEEAFYRHVEVKRRSRDVELPAKKVVITLRDNESNQEEASFSSENHVSLPEVLLSINPRRYTYRKVPGVVVEIPVRRFTWESYHSVLNQFSGFLIPSPSIIHRLDLATRNREIDFRDKDGRLATLYRESGNSWKDNRFDLLYIRYDLLQKYLKLTKQKLVWCNWGERDWANTGMEKVHNPARTKIFQNHQHIHRRFHELEKIQIGTIQDLVKKMA